MRLLSPLFFALAALPSIAGAQTAPKPGKYGCSESIPRYRNGSFEYDTELRGYIVLEKGGRYTDPYRVAGTFTTVGDTSRFKGGALDGAVATPMKNDRLWVVIPTAKRERHWSCGRASS